MLKKEFDALADTWEEDTLVLSSLGHTHEAYQKIIAAGDDVLPYIFERLQAHLNHWFYALVTITGIDAASGLDSMSAARIAWLEWGEANGWITCGYCGLSYGWHGYTCPSWLPGQDT